jgi:phosphoadenosine phosphosulfate reductase
VPDKDNIAEAQSNAESWNPQQVLAWAFETFGNGVAISSAFGAEGMALIDMASRVRKDFRVFTVDTEFLFPETYSLIDRIEHKYKIKIERVFSLLSPEEQERAHGAELWSRDPDQCCNLRKVEPLRRKLSELGAWITSIRRDQTSFRNGARKVEWDAKFGLVKVNPIADWSSKQVWRYLLEHGVPYNSLGRRSQGRTLAGDCQDGVWPAHH